MNTAYRGGVGWTHEQDMVDGPRTSPEDIERELSGQGEAVILCLREPGTDTVLACVLLRKHTDHCCLGMLSVSPQAQDGGLGRALLRQRVAW